MLHAISVNRNFLPRIVRIILFVYRLTRDLTLVCTRAAQPYRLDSRDSTTRGASFVLLSLCLSLSFLHLATHYPVSVHERVSPINLSGDSRLNLDREFYLASFNCSMKRTRWERHGARLSCSSSSSWSRSATVHDDFQTLQETRVFSIVVVVVEQVRKFRNGNEQDDGIRVSNLIIVDAFT